MKGVEIYKPFFLALSKKRTKREREREQNPIGYKKDWKKNKKVLKEIKQTKKKIKQNVKL